MERAEPVVCDQSDDARVLVTVVHVRAKAVWRNRGDAAGEPARIRSWHQPSQVTLGAD